MSRRRLMPTESQHRLHLSQQLLTGRTLTQRPLFCVSWCLPVEKPGAERGHSDKPEAADTSRRLSSPSMAQMARVSAPHRTDSFFLHAQQNVTQAGHPVGPHASLNPPCWAAHRARPYESCHAAANEVSTSGWALSVRAARSTLASRSPNASRMATPARS